MPPIRKAAHSPTPTRQASIGEFFVKRPGPAPPSVSKSRLPKWEPKPVEVKAGPVKPEAIVIDEEAPIPEPVEEIKFPRYPVIKGEKDAKFRDDRYDWDGKYYKIIGTTTKRINLGNHFVVTDKILNQISALDPKICKSIAVFTFDYSDVSYDAHNGAATVTDASIIRFAQACPNLTHFLLPDVGKAVTDAALNALTKYCPKLAEVELSGAEFDGQAFETLRADPERCPRLKKIRVHDIAENRKAMKPLREASKARPDLVIYMTRQSEEKRYGDWEMVTCTDVYIQGRKCPDGKLPKKKRAYNPGGGGSYNRYNSKAFIGKEIAKGYARWSGSWGN